VFDAGRGSSLEAAGRVGRAVWGVTAPLMERRGVGCARDGRLHRAARRRGACGAVLGVHWRMRVRERGLVFGVELDGTAQRGWAGALIVTRGRFLVGRGGVRVRCVGPGRGRMEVGRRLVWIVLGVRRLDGSGRGGGERANARKGTCGGGRVGRLSACGVGRVLFATGRVLRCWRLGGLWVG
jgi:hypothetical protein